MEQNIIYSMGKEGASNLVSLLSKSLEPAVDMHNNDRVIFSCGSRGEVENVSGNQRLGRKSWFSDLLEKIQTW